MPHTLEEAYEVAEAAGRGDPAKLLRRAGRPAVPDLLPGAAAVGAGRGRPGRRRRRHHRQADPPPPARVRRCARRRHGRRGAQHVGADQERAGGAQRHLPRRPRGAARHCCTRARCSGAPPRWASTGTPGTARGAISSPSWRSCARRWTRRRRRSGRSTSPTRDVVHETGDLLFAASTSPGWRASIPSWRCAPPPTASATRVDGAAELAAGGGESFADLSLEEQDGWYRRAKESGRDGI